MKTATVPQLSSKTLKRGAPPEFDKLAHAYRWMEYLSFGPALSQCRTEFLGRLMQRRNALVIGDGDGRFTARLLKSNSTIRVDAIDLSPAMLRSLLRRAGCSADRVRDEAADARDWKPANTAPYDLVVTHFFLDCLTTNEVQSLTEKVRSASDSNTLWIVSEFAVPHSSFGRIVAGPMVALLYRAFAILTGLKVRTLPDHASALASAGFLLQERRIRIFGLLVSELWTLG